MKKGVGIGVLCLVASIAYGQSPSPQQPPDYIPKVVPATPNASKITEYYAQRPNMYTGTANVSVPLYTIDFDGWKLPLSLSYNATGIRTNEEASEVGLGWALSATGVISRSINGGDDFNEGGLQGGRGYVLYEIPVRYNLGFEEGGEEYYPRDTSYYWKLSHTKPDTQPDVFNYSFFGYSGSFVLTQQALGPVKAVKITEDPCLIGFDLQNKVFTVTTPQGFKGTFNVREMSTTVSGSGIVSPDHWLDCCTLNYIDYEYLKYSSGQFRVITSWYLSKITSPRGKEINFTYELSNGRSPNVSLSRSFAEFKDGATSAGESGDPGPRVCLQTIQEHVYLQTITSDEVQVTFAMEPRDDIRKNDLFIWSSPDYWHFPVGSKLKRYKSMTIDGLDASSTLNKTIKFIQTYFDQQFYSPSADNENETYYLRSRLDRVQIDDQEYRFSYELPSGLPNKLTTAMDHFGFYNGGEEADNRMLLPPQTASPFAHYDGTPADTAVVAWYTVREGREVNFDYGKAGLLSKVVYPTGGYSIFTYEPHRYIPDDKPFYKEVAIGGLAGNLAGGARIKSIQDYDYNSADPILTKAYYYTDDYDVTPVNAKTSGKLMTPLFNRYVFVFGQDDKWGYQIIYRTHTGIPGSHSAQGKILGYSKVHEIVKGASDSYRNTYIFENNPNIVSEFNAVAKGTPNLNGQMKTSVNYDNTGKVVQAVINSDYDHSVGDVKGLVYEPKGAPSPFLLFKVPYQLERTFITPYVVRTVTSATPSQIQENNDVITDIGNSKEVIITSSYSDETRLLKTQEVTNSLGELVKTEYKRPSDYTTPSSIMNYMKSDAVHITDPVIEEIVSKDNVVVSARANDYRLETTGTIVNVDRIYMWNPKLGSFVGSADGSYFPSPYELKITFNEHYRGKILQYTASDGMMNSFVWGYNNTLPIVHGINLTYSALRAAYDASTGNETAIRNHANTIGKQITTYVHDPLVGIKTVTNPNQRTTTYNYDSFQRLKSIVDHDGKTLEQYEYNYRKLPPVYNVTASETELNYGVQVPGSYQKLQVGGKYYSNCASPIRSVWLSNNSTVDVMVEVDMHLTSGAYATPFGGGVIPSGSGIEVPVRFNPDSTLAAGTYNTQMIFSVKDAETHAAVSTINVDLKAELQNRVCPSPANLTADFGTVSSTTNRTMYLQLPDNSNAGYRIQGFSYVDTNGQTFVVPPQLWEYNVSDLMPTGCIMPGGGLANPTIAINFHPQNVNYTAPKVATLILQSSASCPNFNVTMKGWYRGSSYWKHMAVDFVGSDELHPTMEDSVTTVVRLTNDGERMLDIRGVTPSPGSTKFWLSATNFLLQPGQQKDITVSFKPGKYDLNTYQTTFTFNVFLESGETLGGQKTFTITGKRNEFKSLKFRQIVGGGYQYYSNIMATFQAMAEQQTFELYNDGNATVSFVSDQSPGLAFSFSDPNGSGPVDNATNYWNVSLANNAASVPAGGTTQLSVRMAPLPGLTYTPQYIIVDFVRSAGVPKVYVDARPLVKSIDVPSSAVTFTSQEDQVFTGTVHVENTGTVQADITGIAFGDNSRFSLVGSLPINIPVNGAIDVTIQYQASAYDFTERTSTVVFSGNFGSRTANVKATRKLRRGLNVGPELKFTQHNTDLYMTVSNSGNNYETLTGLLFTTPNGITYYPSSPSTLYEATIMNPGTSLAPCVPGSCPTQQIKVHLKPGDDPPTEVIVVKFNSPQSGLNDASVTFNVRGEFTRLAYPSSPLSLNTLTTEDYQEGTVRLRNIGNSDFTIHKLEFAHNDPDEAYFQIVSPDPNTAFTLSSAAGSNYVDVVVRYSPALTDTSPRSISLTADADAMEISGFEAVINAQRQPLTRLSFSPGFPSSTVLRFSNPKTLTATVTNTGNQPVLIQSISISNASAFTTTITPSNFAGQYLQPESSIQVYTYPDDYKDQPDRQTSLMIQYGTMTFPQEWVRINY